MAIGDSRRFDDQDLTVEFVARVRKGEHKTAVQLQKIITAFEQLKLAAESPTYRIAPGQWAQIFDVIDAELRDLRAHVERVEARASRGRDRRVEWRDGKPVVR